MCNHAAIDNDSDFLRRQVMDRFDISVAAREDYGLPIREFVAQVLAVQLIANLQAVISVVVCEKEREDSVVDEILAVNPRETLSNHDPAGRDSAAPRRRVRAMIPDRNSRRR